MSRSALRSLRAVKAVHTLAWGFFAGCIVAIPVFSSHGAHAAAAWLAVIVLVEVLVLAVNGWVCPLTAIAARYTQERQLRKDHSCFLWPLLNFEWVAGQVASSGKPSIGTSQQTRTVVA